MLDVRAPGLGVVAPDGSRLYVALSGTPNAGPGVDPKTLPPPDRAAGTGTALLDTRAEDAL